MSVARSLVNACRASRGWSPRTVLLAGLLLAAVSLLAGVLLGERVWPMLAIGLMVLGVAAATIRWPEAVAVGLIFLLYARLSDLYRPVPWLPTINQLAFAVVAPTALLRQVITRVGTARGGLVVDRVFGWLLLYLATILLSLLAQLDWPAMTAAPWAGAADVAAVLVRFLRGEWLLRDALVLLALVNLLTTTRELRRAAWAMVAAAVLLAAATVIDAAFGWNLGGLSSRQFGHVAGAVSGFRFGGPVENANQFAQMLLLPIPLALYLAWSAQGWLPRMLGLLAAMLASVVLVWTYSRSGLVGLLVVFGVAALLRRRQPWRLATIALVLLTASIAAPGLFWERIGSSILVAVTGQPSLTRIGPVSGEDFVPPDESLIFRAGNLRIALAMFLDHPITGTGRDTYLDHRPAYLWHAGPHQEPKPVGPHNVPLHIAAETGILGLAAFTATVWVALWGLVSARRRLWAAGRPPDALLLEGIEVAMYGYLATCLFFNDGLYQRYLWLLVGLAIVGRRLAAPVPTLDAPTTGRTAP